jgi:hypothetical protein
VSASCGEGFEDQLGEDCEDDDGMVRRVGKTASSTLGTNCETASCTACCSWGVRLVGEYGDCGPSAAILSFSVGLEGQCTGGERMARFRTGDDVAELEEAVEGELAFAYYYAG